MTNANARKVSTPARKAGQAAWARAKRAAVKAAKAVPAPRVAELQENGVYAIGRCPRCVALPVGTRCKGCAAELADNDRVWG